MSELLAVSEPPVQSTDEKAVVVSGILFSRSVRSSFASFTLAPVSWLDQNKNQSPNQQPPFLVRLQFMDSVKELRSFCRRRYKIGDKIDFLCTHNGRWEQPPSKEVEIVDIPSAKNNPIDSGVDALSLSWSEQPRWVVDLSNVSQAEKCVVVQNPRVWSMKVCQQYQLKYIPPKKHPMRKQEIISTTKKQKRTNGGGGIQTNGRSAALNGNGESHRQNVGNDFGDSSISNNKNSHHGGGKEKRLQAQELISFFLNMVGGNLNKAEQGTPTLEQRKEHQKSIRDWFNRADGVLDVAGGCGHVSMALGLEGISSTVVDARASVGKLPKRDRKIWKKSLRNRPSNTSILKNNNNDSTEKNNVRPQSYILSDYEYCQPVVPAPAVVPFQSQQAWFGSKPVGYDASFRHPDEEDIPVLVATAVSNNDKGGKSAVGNDSNLDQHAGGDKEVGNNSSSDSAILRRRVSALVALHPDEATGEIVEQAVRHRIPFVVIPCCVFARLFPNRTTKDGRPVSSYEDLLDFLQEQDPSIQRAQLSFGGKNIALWSVFPDG